MRLEWHQNRHDPGCSSGDRRDAPGRPNRRDHLARLRRGADRAKEPADPSWERSQNGQASHLELHSRRADFPDPDVPDQRSSFAQSCRRDVAFPVPKQKDCSPGADRPDAAFPVPKQKDYCPDADRRDAEPAWDRVWLRSYQV